MPKKLIKTTNAASPRGAYSQGFRAGHFVFTAGTGPIDPKTGEVVGNSIEEQTHRTLRNLEAILRSAGAGFGDVVKATVHLSDPRDFARFNSVYATYFSDPKPARTTVGSRLDAVPGMMVEIDLVAYTDSE